MRDLTPEVTAALKAVCSHVYFFYPNSFTTTPLISFYDLGNTSDDGMDNLTRVAFQIDCWDKTVAGCKALVAGVDTVIRGLGFRRSFSQSISDPSGLRRQTMRFEGTYNALDQKLYSR